MSHKMMRFHYYYIACLVEGLVRRRGDCVVGVFCTAMLFRPDLDELDCLREREREGGCLMYYCLSSA